MPYVNKTDRDLLDISAVPPAGNPGQLNFQFTQLAIRYFTMPGKGNYQAINDVIGALEGAKLEFYRRLAAPYEDKKIAENGDVY